MRFYTRKWVKPEDLNPNQTLFGGRLLQWIDEEAALYAIAQFENKKIVTKYISDINFQDKAVQGDIIEIGMEARNMMTRKTIITIDSIIMVNLGPDGKPAPHHKTEIEFVKDRLKGKED